MDENTRQFYRQFGKRLQALRGNTGLTQPEFAEEIGVSRNQIALYERGADMPSLWRLPTIVTVLGCSYDELMGTSEPLVLDHRGERHYLIRLITQAPIDVLRVIRPILQRML